MPGDNIHSFSDLSRTSEQPASSFQSFSGTGHRLGGGDESAQSVTPAQPAADTQTTPKTSKPTEAFLGKLRGLYEQKFQAFQEKEQAHKAQASAETTANASAPKPAASKKRKKSDFNFSKQLKTIRKKAAEKYKENKKEIAKKAKVKIKEIEVANTADFLNHMKSLYQGDPSVTDVINAFHSVDPKKTKTSSEHAVSNVKQFAFDCIRELILLRKAHRNDGDARISSVLEAEIEAGVDGIDRLSEEALQELAQVVSLFNLSIQGITFNNKQTDEASVLDLIKADMKAIMQTPLSKPITSHLKDIALVRLLGEDIASQVMQIQTEAAANVNITVIQGSHNQVLQNNNAGKQTANGFQFSKPVTQAVTADQDNDNQLLNSQTMQDKVDALVDAAAQASDLFAKQLSVPSLGR